MYPKMSCPQFVDYVRECRQHFNQIAGELNTTVRFCTSDNHVNCPFFIFLESPHSFCDYFTRCSLCKHFIDNKFDGFVDIVEKWCLTDHYATCARHIRKYANASIPDNLYPDGTRIGK